MEQEKINAVGQALDVKIEDIKQGWKYRFSKIAYLIIQGLVFFVSWIWGDFARPRSNYPFSYSPAFPSSNFVPALIFTGVIHAGNGLFIIPGTTQLLPGRHHRIKIYIGNIIISLTVFLLAAIVSPVDISNTLYGVYDTPQEER